MKTVTPEVAALPSATILLLRDGGPGLEVFMVKRHQAIEFAPGALVFPGGKVEPADTGDGITEVCAGHRGLSAEELGYRVCAIRETFEEAGILLAREAGAAALLGGERLAQIQDRHRAPLRDGRVSLGDIAGREKLVLACGDLAPFAHWVTPKSFPKRYDTLFFLAPAPADQLASHDRSETVDSVWITADRALADAEAGRRRIVFATRMNLSRLRGAGTVAQAVAAARESEIVTVEPAIKRVEGGRIFSIPEAAGYGVREILEKD